MKNKTTTNSSKSTSEDNTEISYHRQTEIFDTSQHKELIEIIGAGAIGSFRALTLGKMGIDKIRIWDNDTIEEHNIPNQFYPLPTVSMTKVFALSGIIEDYTGCSLITCPNMFEENDVFMGDVIISAVDNMETRKMLFEIAKRQHKKWFIDARIGGEVMLHKFPIVYVLLFVAPKFETNPMASS